MERKRFKSDNSFLQETERISDISSTIREEIEDRFNKSLTNKNYIFPRVLPNKQTKPRRIRLSQSSEKLLNIRKMFQSLTLNNSRVQLPLFRSSTLKQAPLNNKNSQVKRKLIKIDTNALYKSKSFKYTPQVNKLSENNNLL